MDVNKKIEKLEQQLAQQAMESARYALIFEELSSDYFYETRFSEEQRPNGILWIVGAFDKIVGYTVEEINAKEGGWIAIVHEEDRTWLEPEVMASIQDKKSGEYEYRIVCKDGEIRWLEDQVKIKETASGIRILGTVRDITTRKKAQLELEEGEERYGTLFHQSQNGIILVDIEANQAIDANQRMVDIFETSREHLLQSKMLDFSPPNQPNGEESGALLHKKIGIHRKTKKVIKFEWQFETTKRKKFFAQVTISPIILNRKPISVLFVEDIDDQKKAEQELATTQQQLRLLADNLDGSFWLVNRAREFLYMSEGHEKLWEVSVESLLEQPEDYLSIIHPEDYQKMINVRRDLFDPKLPSIDVQYRIIPKSGKIKWIWTKTFSVQQENGVQLVGGLNSDITELKEKEAELIAARKKAEESDRLKSQFLATMSHEIRTPMNGIIGFAEMLVDPDIPNVEKTDYASIINDNCQRLLHVLNDILEISKIETNKVILKYSNIDVNVILKELHNLFLANARNKKLQLQVEKTLPIDTPLIKTDEMKLRQILNNLLNNAMKFTAEGSIFFGVEIKGDQLEFFIRDTGIGISETHQDTIFDRFHQATADTPTLFGGTGLGLSISKGFAELLGGNIRVQSRLGEGATFYLRLPYQPIEDKASRKKQLAETIKINKLDLSGHTILVAEDEQFNFMLVQGLLRQAKTNIVRAKTGKEAVELLEEYPEIDLILMDIKMPEMDGIEATKIIKANPKYNHIPIIAQTAFGLQEDKERILNAGCDDFLSKPIKRDLFQEIVRKYLL